VTDISEHLTADGKLYLPGGFDDYSLFPTPGYSFNTKDGTGELVSDVELRPLRLALAAGLGAATSEAVLTFSAGLQTAFTVQRIPGHLLAIFIGAIIGWLLEFSRQLISSARQVLDRAAEAEKRLEMLAAQLEPHATFSQMLRDCPSHADSLHELVDAATRKTLNVIPYVGPTDYLKYLQTAIRESRTYHGVQRNPIGWYRDRDAASYLAALSKRGMRAKVRLILIDDSDVAQMERDLKNREVMEYFWRHNGSVQTYWTTVSDFRHNCPGVRVPDDFALYDSKLLIAYDESKHTLRYRTVSEGADELKICSALREDSFSPIARPPRLARSWRNGNS
jgi:hypothetical protein